MRATRWWGRFWYGLWLGIGLWLLRETLVPAPVRNLRVRLGAGAGPYYAELSWQYGAGTRPVSTIFDLEAGAAQGSITTDGEASEAAIPLGVRPRGSYQLNVSATYRILGHAHTRVSSTQGTL